MDNKPLISVIIPVYNVENYLSKCVDSVLQQDVADIEVILVNDGSTDGSAELCDHFAKQDERVTVIHKKNGGPTSARTTGCENATGDYVTFLDSDDWFLPGILPRVADVIKTYSPDAILFNFERVEAEQTYSLKNLLDEGLYGGENGNKIKHSLIYDERDLSAITYGIAAKVYKAEQYVEYQRRVPKQFYKGEDLCVVAPLLLNADKVYVLDTAGYAYRDTPNSIMNSFKKDEWEQVTGVAQYLRKEMGDFYQSRIDVFVVTHLFDYLDRAILHFGNYSEYIRLARSIVDEQLLCVLKRAKSHSQRFMDRFVFSLTKHRLFSLIWLLRKIKKRS